LPPYLRGMDLSPLRPQRIRVMGQPVDLVTCEQVMRFLTRKVEGRRKSVIANHNAHSLYLIDRHPEMRAFYSKAELIEVDSTPLILWGKLMGEAITRRHRCTYLCWRDQFWALADQNQWRIFYLGGEPGVAEAAASNLRRIAPGAVIQTRDGYFDMSTGSAENAAVVAEINAFRPNVLFVGMGMPRQEIWIERNYAALDDCVTLPVGAAFDYEAGVQTAAPRWTGRVGIEWAFRFATDPQRLFRRYFVEPWSLIPVAFKDASGRIAPRATITARPRIEARPRLDIRPQLNAGGLPRREPMP
jgi:N-acetylglucosaminyldiphosphoundecaprenol N-acetyl-beta-D-mannosaminyltransferase